MPRNLILIRHCKSSWDAFGQDDHARPLNERGQRSAPLIGQWLKDKDYMPDEVLCSDAARTRETWALIADAMGVTAPVDYRHPLYLAPDLIMLEQLRGATGETVAMIGHNPGIADFADDLVSAPPQHDRFADYPTGATTVITFDIEAWADLQEGSGTVADFCVPRDLEAGKAG